ncbi:peptidoglycan-binding protein [Streptomyces beihaiensis]|uniref:Peptidoglycan-binding protein n=1 Tax=Streptomyces beihaiensis TaxID=2984495 RepID=A0ABT3U308_9ACTN|nr:peptidoglycan-binding protein [Streptomyces beihaiensis]MCX3063674.1 peptidoglycan-binding protein [Streptomyces beihaiensis]
MPVPAFEEISADDCDCAGCAQWRRTVPPPVRTRVGARHALVAAAAASTVIAGLHSAPAGAAEHHESRPGPGPGDPSPGNGNGSGSGTGTDTPQGGTSPLHGSPVESGSPGAPVSISLVHESAPRATTRSAIIARAKTWVAAKVPYSMNKFWKDGYRQDCSGFVSMAWGLPGNEWTGSLAQYGTRISKAQLRPGDILLFHNPANPEKGSHVTIFGGWANTSRTYYIAYEQTRPGTRKQVTPYAYWSNSNRYVPYRYKGVSASDSGSPGASSGKFPGADMFGPGADNVDVTRLGRMLVERGGKRFYKVGPGPHWGAADRRATQAFQRAQGWHGRNADGIPGPTTWSYLVNGEGKDIPGTRNGAAAGNGGGAGASGASSETGKAPAYPGRAAFRPGAVNASVTRLGKQLVKKGFGKHYRQGPGPRWSEADRRNVEAFQRAQGWRGAAADGYPGPETWRRLFS